MSVEEIFRDVAMLSPVPPKDEDQEYQRFVESMVPLCHCAERYRPCDGVLAGGLCDGMREPDRDIAGDDEGDDE